MSFRLATGGSAIDRGAPVTFNWNGKRLQGFEGDTLASALLANDRMGMGRSFKYHRLRGPVAAGPEEPNALVGLGTGPRFEPNQRATTTELFDGLTATSQNHWPSLEFDVGAINAAVSRLFPAGFYYKTFIHPRAFWKHLFEPVIRQAAGLGKAPTEPDADTYEYFYAHVDVLVVGGGIAGLQAASTAAASGAEVLLIEQGPILGGRARVDEATIDGQRAPDWIAAETARLAALPNVRIRTRMMGAGVYDHGYVLAYERCGDHLPDHTGPRHRLWRIRARQIITATGAIERPLAFAGNDMPGVMLASAVRDYLGLYGVAAGQRTVLVTNNDDAYRTALALKAAGLDVPLIADAREVADGPLPDRGPGRRHPDRHRGRRRWRQRTQDCPRGGNRRAIWQRRGPRNRALRRHRHVRWLVPGRASLVPLRRQAPLERGSGAFRARSEPPADRRQGRTIRHDRRHRLRRDVAG